ncbi:hypothetical protein KIPB_009951, partial [Kipferlia bialata]|eukprot:g9951.t1
MRISIVGSGAIGCLVGSMLSRAGLDVTLVDRHQSRIDIIRAEGLYVRMPNERVNTKISITGDPTSVGVCDVVMLCVKGYHTASAIEGALCMVGPNTL